MQLTIPLLTADPWSVRELDQPIPGGTVRVFRVVSGRAEYVVLVADRPEADVCGCHGGPCVHRRLARQIVEGG
jgi:hypothetical protein